MFEKTLTDVIRGLRANKKNEAKYISIVLDEVRKELKSNDLDVKANAITKLTYLQMLGYEMSWASFNVIEVMSSAKFADKRIGYLAAAQSFSPETDVLMLATNLIKKDMASQNLYEVGIALNGLANVASTDLARDLSSDVVNLMNHSKPYVRKKAILALYKVFLRFPEALRPAFPRLKDKLTDDDPAVVSAAVNVICELARKNPKNYLAQAPQLFKLLTGSSNNWMLIKIIKLFGALMPLEPRLAKKLADPITNIITTTPAMSLLYECINTVTQSEMDDLRLVRLCVQKLRIFIEDPDQNLKYLGLLALSKFLAAHPKVVSEHNDVILKCIDDEDVSIRFRALDLLMGMVTKKNLPDIVRKLLSQLDSIHSLSTDPLYRTEMVKRVVDLCSLNSYQHVTDFEWYITVLVTLCKTEGANQGKLLASQLLDVAVRVKVVREHMVKEMLLLLMEERLYGQFGTLSSNRDVLSSAAWIVGEYSELLENPGKAIQLLTKPTIASLPGFIQATFVQNAFKILIRVAMSEQYEAELPTIMSAALPRLTAFTHSSHLEVQERAAMIVQLLQLANNQHLPFSALAKLVQGELNPVAKKAQQKVPLPAEIDLDEWINADDNPLLRDDVVVTDGDFHFGGTQKAIDLSFLDEKASSRGSDEEDEDGRQSRAVKQAERRKHDPFYLGGSTKSKKNDTPTTASTDDIDSIPIARLDLGPSTKLEVKPAKTKKGKKGKAAEPEKTIEIIKNEEMPEGADHSDDEKDGKKQKAKGAKAFTLTSDFDVDLTTPLGADEQLPTMKAYATPEEVRKRAEEAARKKAQDEEKAQKAKKVAKDEKAKKKQDEKDKKKDKKDKAAKGKKASAQADLLQLDEPAAGTLAAEPKAKKKEKGVKGKDGGAKKDKASGKKVNSEGEANVDRGAYEDVALTEPEPTFESDDVPLPPTFRVIASDNNMRVSYSVEVDGNLPNKCSASFAIENLSETGTLSGIEFNLRESLNLKIDPSTIGFKDGAVRVPFTIAPQEQNAFAIAFNVKDITQSQELKSVLTYTLREGGSSALHKLEPKLPFSVGAFLVAEQCDFERLRLLLQEPSNFPALVQTSLPLSANRALPNAVAVIASLLHMWEVRSEATKAMLYGRTIQGHHVALLAKLVQDGAELSVEIRAGDDRLAGALKTQLEKEFF